MSADPAPPPPPSSWSAAAAATARLALLPLVGGQSRAYGGCGWRVWFGRGWVERPCRLLRLMSAMLLLCSICASYITMLSTSCSCAARRHAPSRIVSAPFAPPSHPRTHSPSPSRPATHAHALTLPRSAVPHHAYLPRDARAVSRFCLFLFECFFIFFGHWAVVVPTLHIYALLAGVGEGSCLVFNCNP